METVWIVLTHLTFLHLVKGSVTNVARNKPASMSSDYQGLFNAATAVDGDTNAVYPGGIIHTATRQSFAWWKVDLQRDVQNATVEIYFRTDYKYHRNGVQIYTSTTPFSSYPAGQLCYTVTGNTNGSDIDDVVSVTCPGRWRYLLVYTNTDNERSGPILDFGEVEVIDCVSNYYGSGCSLLCSNRKCLNPASPCDHVTGLCVGGCQSGYKGTDCVQLCSPGTYGSRCSKLCSARHCLNSSAPCNSSSGSCDGDCRSGWRGTDCTQECQTGIYGVNCMKSCSSRHCVTPSSECDRQTGQCIGGCQEGWRGVDCVQECPAGTFGVRCTSCSTRHCQGDSDCPADGRCSQGCQDGWILTTCTQACPPGSYGAGCYKTCGSCSADSICNHVTGYCSEGCEPGWMSERCDKVSGGGAPVNTNCGTVVGAVVGTFLVVVLVGVGIHLCLIRQGRLQWVKVTNKDKSNQNTGDNTQMRNLGQEHVNGAEHAHSSYAYNNDYAELNAETQTGNQDYDVIEQKHYQNV